MMANHSKPEEITNLIPVGRFGRPEEIASVVEMLAGNGYMTNKVSDSTDLLPPFRL
ncbi:hypothetical protein PLICRDRAFT_45579 [Plicaturopsis crispa FD-325 SS-3]|uniref:Unplaced genomic scaffold PLICRscaffold_16, whole genome shotgun sequence n=1 Tax=Plicaturopsis crispa FD-325 SS-3 TaxID=944288 RepID=A0A0C9T972_PLICR|nr:hypothetical protein PLICRDRAFT_45579 [Plicaturopsis crispa FD-325 SS-3]